MSQSGRERLRSAAPYLVATAWLVLGLGQRRPRRGSPGRGLPALGLPAPLLLRPARHDRGPLPGRRPSAALPGGPDRVPGAARRDALGAVVPPRRAGRALHRERPRALALPAGLGGACCGASPARAPGGWPARRRSPTTPCSTGTSCPSRSSSAAVLARSGTGRRAPARWPALGVSAKLFPVALLPGAIGALACRRRRWADLARAGAAFAGRDAGGQPAGGAAPRRELELVLPLQRRPAAENSVWQVLGVKARPLLNALAARGAPGRGRRRRPRGLARRPGVPVPRGPARHRAGAGRLDGLEQGLEPAVRPLRLRGRRAGGRAALALPRAGRRLGGRLPPGLRGPGRARDLLVLRRLVLRGGAPPDGDLRRLRGVAPPRAAGDAGRARGDGQEAAAGREAAA